MERRGVGVSENAKVIERYVACRLGRTFVFEKKWLVIRGTAMVRRRREQRHIGVRKMGS